MRKFGLATRLLAVALSLSVVGCGDDDPAGPDQGVYRMWEEDGPGRFYVHIEPDQITIYDEVEFPCHLVEAFPVVERNGDVFTLSSMDAQADLVIRRAGDALTIEFEDGSVDAFTASDVDPDALEEC